MTNSPPTYTPARCRWCLSPTGLVLIGGLPFCEDHAIEALQSWQVWYVRKREIIECLHGVAAREAFERSVKEFA